MIHKHVWLIIISIQSSFDNKIVTLPFNFEVNKITRIQWISVSQINLLMEMVTFKIKYFTLNHNFLYFRHFYISTSMQMSQSYCSWVRILVPKNYSRFSVAGLSNFYTYSMTKCGVHTHNSFSISSYSDFDI